MSEHEFGVDIPKRRQAEQAQRSMDDLFRALIENALDVITILDTEGVIRYQTPSIERVLGYMPAELIGVNIVDLLHPDDALGAYYRRMRARHGAPSAITATAHKLARIIYFMLKERKPYHDFGAEYYEQHYRTRVLRNLNRQAVRLGFRLEPSVKAPVLEVS